MRAFIFLFCALVFSLTPENVISQNSKIKIENDKTLTIDEVFDLIMNQTDYNFFYEEGIFKDFPNVHVKKGVVRTNKLLKKSLLQGNFEITITNEFDILIKRKSKEVSPVIQEIQISGIISDSNGQPLPGANVLEKGTTNGTQTDFDGNFSIAVTNQNSVLVVSYIGFLTQEVNLNNQTKLTISLQEDAAKLDEVVVTALGIRKQKKSLTYSTQQVDKDELTKARSVNVVNGLSGKVAGLSVTPATGSGVGSESKVLLRGNRSISGSSQPLYVVDGILLNGGIANISPNDIASISVLKGANAAALYGSRANNGAIIITTKSGKGAEGTTTSIGFASTIDSPIHLLDFQNEFGQGSQGVHAANAVTSWGSRFDGSQVPHWSNDPNSPEFGTTYSYEAQPNNIKDLFRKGHRLSTNLSVNINNEKSNVFLGYTFTDAAGIVPGNNLTRHNITTRINAELTNKLSVDAKVSYIRDDFSNILLTSPLSFLYKTPRNIRTQDIAHYQFVNNEGKTRQHFYRPDTNGFGNPYWTMNNITSPSLKERVLGLFSLKYNITENLSITGRSTLDRVNSASERLWHNDTYTNASLGRYIEASSSEYDWNTDFLLNFKKRITDDFEIDVNVGANQRKFQSTALTGDGNNFTIENFFALSNTTDPTATQNFSRFETQSVYGLLELSYKDAIFLNITGRNDWSSTLPKANRSYFYPSIGLTAVVSDLVEMPDFMNFLKLRSSWAEVGNDTSPFQLSRRADILTGTLLLNPILPNADLKPESTRSLEFGFNTRFVDNRVKLDLTWYKTNTSDQLFQTPVPVASGIASIFQNGADIQNTGIEITLGATVIKNDSFSWDLDFNFATNKSEVIEIAEGFDELTISEDFVRQYRLVKGGEFGDIYTRGFSRDDQGRVIVNANGIPLLTPGFDVKAANFNPDWLGGIRSSFRYKNFTLSALVDIRQGGSLVSLTEATLASTGVLSSTVQGRDGSLVFGENFFSNEIAVTESGSANTITTNSEDFWNTFGGAHNPIGEPFVKDASNIRLRELIIGYSLPEKIIKNTFLTSANVSLTGRNLFFFSNKAGILDPEIVQNSNNDAEGREKSSPPTTRSIGLSVNLSF